MPPQRRLGAIQPFPVEFSPFDVALVSDDMCPPIDSFTMLGGEVAVNHEDRLHPAVARTVIYTAAGYNPDEIGAMTGVTTEQASSHQAVGQYELGADTLPEMVSQAYEQKLFVVRRAIRLVGLNDNDTEVLRLTAEGLTAPQIAARISTEERAVSVPATKGRLRYMRERLNAPNLESAVQLGYLGKALLPRTD